MGSMVQLSCLGAVEKKDSGYSGEWDFCVCMSPLLYFQRSKYMSFVIFQGLCFFLDLRACSFSSKTWANTGFRNALSLFAPQALSTCMNQKWHQRTMATASNYWKKNTETHSGTDQLLHRLTCLIVKHNTERRQRQSKQRNMHIWSSFHRTFWKCTMSFRALRLNM